MMGCVTEFVNACNVVAEIGFVVVDADWVLRVRNVGGMGGME